MWVTDWNLRVLITEKLPLKSISYSFAIHNHRTEVSLRTYSFYIPSYLCKYPGVR